MDKNNRFNVLQSHKDDEDEEELILNHQSSLMAAVQEGTHQGGVTIMKKKSSLPPITSSSTIPLEGPKKAQSEGNRAKERGTIKPNSHNLQGGGELPVPKYTPQAEGDNGVNDTDDLGFNLRHKSKFNLKKTSEKNCDYTKLVLLSYFILKF